MEQKIKGLLFGGCSFTWGQGLYYYSNLPNLPFQQDYAFNSKNITEAMIKHKNSIRFPRLVSNGLNTFEVCKSDVGLLLGNGGSEDETFDFFDYLFNVERKYTYKDFSHIVIQLSNPFRNSFTFELGGVNYKTKIMNTYLYPKIDEDVVGGEEFNEYCKLNNFSLEDVQNLHLVKQYKRLKEKILFYNSKGIDVRVICWFDDVINISQDDDFIKNKLIKLCYKNNVFKTIMNLMDSDNDLIIEGDFKNNHNVIVKDGHPSKLCHEVIAESIIKNLKID